jgi:hypothetical protein
MPPAWLVRLATRPRLMAINFIRRIVDLSQRLMATSMYEPNSTGFACIVGGMGTIKAQTLGGL